MIEGRSTTKSTAASVLQFMISLTKSDAGRWLKIGPNWETGILGSGLGWIESDSKIKRERERSEFAKP